MLNVLWVCLMLTFGILGIKYPQRWVFIAGAGVVAQPCGLRHGNKRFLDQANVQRRCGA
jgi:hypothetical protein